MTISDPVASAENKSSEPESSGSIHELGRAVAAFQQTENSDHEMSSEDRTVLLGQVLKISMDELDRVIVGCKRCGENWRSIRIAFNGTWRRTKG